jgi:biotin carboxylase
MKEALQKIEIKGVATTIPLHLKILDSEMFKNGDYHTGIVRELGQF